jgi:predicted metal-dependent phosphoesterase TrpH
MKGMFWFLLFILALLFGYLIFNFVYHRSQQAGIVVFEVGADTIKAYEQRVAELEQTAKRIRSRVPMAPINERWRLERRLAVLDEEIRNLKVAVEQWRSARTQKSAADIYRQCILLYGKAAGVCEVLTEDTLPLVRPQE